MPVIAITGGIGSGKSTVRRMFEELGAFGIDADDLARQVVEPGSRGARLLMEEFGPAFFDSEGRLDRRQMAAKVFNDPSARHKIESILHPLIRAAEKEVLEDIRRRDPKALVAVEIPLLVEGGRWKDYSAVILVTAPDQVRISRLVESGRYTREEAASRMASQLKDEERSRLATWTINNGENVDATARQVKKVYEAITAA
ncbi:MAG: dephospho-CoA kinase [bacterium]|nr:MAG: dephospho-CoA kinase [bacterium]